MGNLITNYTLQINNYTLNYTLTIKSTALKLEETSASGAVFFDKSYPKNKAIFRSRVLLQGHHRSYNAYQKFLRFM